MKSIIVVFLGGGLGSVARFLLGKAINDVHTSAFPWGTFIVNIIGCFLIGAILTITERHSGFSVYWKLILATGFCGGFTTFSSFAFENNILIQNREILYFILYTSLSVFIGLLFTYLGIVVVRNLS